MPLRKHFLYTDARGRRSIDHDAYYLLQQRAANGEIPARLFRAAAPTFPHSFRKGIPMLQKLLVDSGLTVDIRTFTSRKNARKGRSKLHAVRKELSTVRSLPAFRAAAPTLAEPMPTLHFTPDEMLLIQKVWVEDDAAGI